MEVWPRKRLQEARLCHCPWTTSPTSVVLADLSMTEACRKRWLSRVQGCVPGSVQGSFCEELENEVNHRSTGLRGCSVREDEMARFVDGPTRVVVVVFSESMRYPPWEDVCLPQLAMWKDLLSHVITKVSSIGQARSLYQRGGALG